MKELITESLNKIITRCPTLSYDELKLIHVELATSVYNAYETGYVDGVEQGSRLEA